MRELNLAYDSTQCLVIGKDAKNVKKEEALDYVGGWTVGNDISSRKLQSNPALAGVIPQFGFSKGFDTYAPMGPCLVAPDIIGDPSGLHLTTKINGEVRQDEGVNDLLFDCAYAIEYLSQGTTLQKGSVIMTGTPGGKWFYPVLAFSPLANLQFMQVWEMVLSLHAFLPQEMLWK